MEQASDGQVIGVRAELDRVQLAFDEPSVRAACVIFDIGRRKDSIPGQFIGDCPDTQRVESPRRVLDQPRIIEPGVNPGAELTQVKLVGVARRRDAARGFTGAWCPGCRKDNVASRASAPGDQRVALRILFEELLNGRHKRRRLLRLAGFV